MVQAEGEFVAGTIDSCQVILMPPGRVVDAQWQIAEGGPGPVENLFTVASEPIDEGEWRICGGWKMGEAAALAQIMMVAEPFPILPLPNPALRMGQHLSRRHRSQAREIPLKRGGASGAH